MDYRQSVLVLVAVALLAPAFARPPKPPSAPRPLPTTPTDMCGKPVEMPQPDYPLAALKMAQSGWVLVEFSITMDGTVAAPKVFDSSPAKLFDASAIKAVGGAKFAPSEEVRDMCRQLVEFSIGRWDT